MVPYVLDRKHLINNNFLVTEHKTSQLNAFAQLIKCHTVQCPEH